MRGLRDRLTTRGDGCGSDLPVLSGRQRGTDPGFGRSDNSWAKLWNVPGYADRRAPLVQIVEARSGQAHFGWAGMESLCHESS